jgi:hypothetical protein
MSKRINQLADHQPRAKVTVSAHDAASARAWFVTLAIAFAGVFYFWGYYFWAHLWRVLTGG